MAHVIRPDYEVKDFSLSDNKKPFPKKNVLRASNGVTLKWRKKAVTTDDFDTIDYRDIHINLFVGEKIIGSVKLRELKIRECEDGIVSLHNVIDSCDSIDQELYDFSYAIKAYVEMNTDADDVFPGEIFVEFSELRMKKEYASNKIWVKPLNEFFAKHYKDGDVALLLKPFPLEFSNIMDEPTTTASQRTRLERRIRAMETHYEQALDVMSLPDDDTPGTWMGKTLSSTW